MFVRMTFNKDDPAAVDEANALYNSDEVSGVIGRQKGHRFHYLLRSVEDPTESVSVSAWDSREDAEAYERSGAYKDLLGKFDRFHTRPSELRTYEVVGEGSARRDGRLAAASALLLPVSIRLPFVSRSYRVPRLRFSVQPVLEVLRHRVRVLLDTSACAILTRPYCAPTSGALRASG